MWFIHFPDKPCHEWRDQSRVLVDSSLSCTNILSCHWIPACSCLSLWKQCRGAGAGCVSSDFTPNLGFRCLSSLCPRYLKYRRIEFICFLPSTCCDSVSTGWESFSCLVEVSLAYEPLLWSFISMFASLITTNKIQGWQDLCEVQWGEKMNKDEDSSF